MKITIKKTTIQVTFEWETAMKGEAVSPEIIVTPSGQTMVAP